MSQANHREELGNEPMDMTVSLSLVTQNFAVLAFDSRPVRNPIEDFDSVSNSKLFGATRTSFELTFGFLMDLGPRFTPHGQVVIFLKQALW